MQALRCAAAGTRASSSGAKRAVVHQQGVRSAPLPAHTLSLAQALGWPHSGQRQGSTAASVGFMAGTFSQFSRPAGIAPLV